MARNIITNDVVPLLSALKQMYKAADFGANATSLNVEQLVSIIDQIFFNYNKARASWDSLVSETGSASAAETVISDYIFPSPVDITTQLNLVRTETVDLMNGYQGSAFGAGSPEKTFSYTLSGNFLQDGHTEVAVSGGVLTAVNGFCSDLRTALEPLTDTV